MKRQGSCYLPDIMFIQQLQAINRRQATSREKECFPRSPCRYAALAPCTGGAQSTWGENHCRARLNRIEKVDGRGKSQGWQDTGELISDAVIFQFWWANGFEEWPMSGQKIMILGIHREEKMSRWRLDQYEDTILRTKRYQWKERSCTPVLVSPVFPFSRFPSRKAHGQGQGQALTGFAYPNDATLVHWSVADRLKETREDEEKPGEFINTPLLRSRLEGISERGSSTACEACRPVWRWKRWIEGGEMLMDVQGKRRSIRVKRKSGTLNGSRGKRLPPGVLSWFDFPCIPTAPALPIPSRKLILAAWAFNLLFPSIRTHLVRYGLHSFLTYASRCNYYILPSLNTLSYTFLLLKQTFVAPPKTNLFPFSIPGSPDYQPNSVFNLPNISNFHIDFDLDPVIRTSLVRPLSALVTDGYTSHQTPEFLPAAAVNTPASSHRHPRAAKVQ
ncbi:uncharacterized protein CLUP02_02402 [Colletotrichum lupini]|uniref:Uncharacterized protein n=1 Tax=Colletotrichum lupini TaxID=145971 RepID=A0A9Q8SGG0_9PEZI|nr:uncharacterized protein CLUP02_02402 [Colletotrichum lupini]UQC76936.1 hypothetical protein CLUP02_02402 [Colletotrichum lupini]